MANQYTGNFEEIVRNKFNCSAEEILLKCKREGLSYQDAEKILGFKHVTIRKWAKRFDIKLLSRFKIHNESNFDDGYSYVQDCKEEGINKTNAFSRLWVNMSLYSSIKAKS